MPNDLEEFFSSVGYVRDVRILTDAKTRRSKGVAYVEFWDLGAAAMAVDLAAVNKLHGVPLVASRLNAEPDRPAASAATGITANSRATADDPPVLRVDNIPSSVTDDTLTTLLEPYGAVDSCQLIRALNKSPGYALVQVSSTKLRQ